MEKLFRCAKLCEGAGYGIDKILSWKEFSQEKLGISNDLAKYYIDKLKKNGRIKREGPDKGGYWKVNE